MGTCGSDAYISKTPLFCVLVKARPIYTEKTMGGVDEKLVNLHICSLVRLRATHVYAPPLSNSEESKTSPVNTSSGTAS